MKIVTQASGNGNPSTAMVCNAAIADCEDDDHDGILLKFVHALAKRQARLDVRLAINTASDTEPRTLH